jgi:hypothetical protein
MTLAYSHRIESGRTSIMFAGKPPDDVRAMLKANGFRWSPVGGFWWRKGCSGAADFLAALDRKLNPDRPDGACWDCKAPGGFFRPSGPFAPVLCDACHAKRTAANPPYSPYIDRPDPMAVDRAFEDACRDACGL